jgi:hypothetical protein
VQETGVADQLQFLVHGPGIGCRSKVGLVVAIGMR